MESLRDLLEREIVQSIKEGDTTVLFELLCRVSDEVCYASLSDEGQLLHDSRDL